MNCELSGLLGSLQLMRSSVQHDLGASFDERCGRQKLDHGPELANGKRDNCVELASGSAEF